MFIEFLEAINVQPVFLLHATLMIPRVVVRPSLEDVQEALIAAGKFITNVSKGIGQWTGGKAPQVLDTRLHAYGLTSFNVGQYKGLSHSCCILSTECIVH
jgi:hypothetical protein